MSPLFLNVHTTLCYLPAPLGLCPPFLHMIPQGSYATATDHKTDLYPQGLFLPWHLSF